MGRGGGRDAAVRDALWVQRSSCRREAAPVSVDMCNSSRRRPRNGVTGASPLPSTHAAGPGAAGLASEQGLSVHPTQPGKSETKKGFSWQPLSFFLLVLFLLIPFHTRLSPRCPGDTSLRVAVGRRVPAGVEEECKGSSKGQNCNVFSGWNRRAGVRCDFLSVIKSRPR